MTKRMVLALVLLAATGCQEKRRTTGAVAPVGVPGAAGGGAEGGGAGGPGGPAVHPSRMGGGANPHGGMPADDVHAGLEGGGGGGGGHATGIDDTTPNPHDDVDGLAAIDPARAIVGTVEPSAAFAAQVKPGEVIYVTVKQVDDKGQIPAGAKALGVAQLHAGEWPLVFQVSGPPGAQVAVIARVDRDGDGMTRAAGDLEGMTLTAVPGKAVRVVLDTVVP